MLTIRRPLIAKEPVTEASHSALTVMTTSTHVQPVRPAAAGGCMVELEKHHVAGYKPNVILCLVCCRRA